MIRITGGEFRGRSIRAPHHDRTRPTLSKLRQALFNSIQTLVPEAKVLDLFAGSGALGFEALSRGAAEVSFVEKDRATAQLIEHNARDLKVTDRVRISAIPVERCWKALESRAPFDLVIADPPYDQHWQRKLPELLPWAEALVEGGCLILEWSGDKGEEAPEKVPFLVKIREKNYGDTTLTHYTRSSE